MKKALILGTALVLAVSCKEEIEQKAKEAVDKGGQAVEKTANRVVDEVSAHINRDMGCTVIVSEPLKEQGISTGKFYIEKDTVANKDNKLVVYLITDKDYKGSLKFKVADKDGTELGRTALQLNEKAGNAGYHDVQFDNRTDIESKSTITIF